MTEKTVRYTATLPLAHLEELKDMANAKVVPSVNFAVNEAVTEYLSTQKALRYNALMQEARQDEAFLARTLACDEAFKYADSEVDQA